MEIFLASSKKPPRQIVLDMDVTDDQVHGNQEGAFFNSYYKGVCYARVIAVILYQMYLTEEQLQ